MGRLLRRVIRRADAAHWGVLVSTVGVLVLFAALVVVIVYLPPLAVDPHGLGRTDWLTHVESLRATMLQGLGGLALLGTLYFSARTLRLNRRGQLTERFSKAIEHLGSDSKAVRLGGIYALEQIALDSAELHWPVIEVLTAYLREHAAVHTDAEASAASTDRRLPADHQAIATVIGRRRIAQDREDQRLDLRGTDLSGVRWDGAHLEGADLVGAHLEGAHLAGAHLAAADLREAQLEGAHLVDAHLEGASLAGAHLARALLVRAHMEGANLRRAHLEGANLAEACLERASLGEAHLEQVDLFQAHLRDAHGLTPEQLRAANNAHHADLPDELNR